MRVIGIDPGIERTGFAVLEAGSGCFKLLDFGRIMTDKKHSFSNRLASIAADLKIILKQWKPNVAAVEQVFFSKNVKTAMKVSHARGVIMETLEERGIPVCEFNPSHVKSAVTGDCRADKLQVKKMIKYLLGVSLKSDDAADAIACAVCCLQTKKI